MRAEQMAACGAKGKCGNDKELVAANVPACGAKGMWRRPSKEQELRPTKSKSNINSFCGHPSDSDCDFTSYYGREFIFDKVEAAMCSVRPPFRTSQQELSECLTHDVVRNFTFNERGSCILQRAFELLMFEQRYEVVMKLRGYVVKAVKCPNGNYVVQKAVVWLPPKRTRFILQEIKQHWSGVELARHRFGCRVLMRMIEHYPYAMWSELCESIIGTLEGGSPCRGMWPSMFEPCFHAVLQHIIEFCPDDGPKARITIVVTRAAYSVSREWSFQCLCDLLYALLTYSVFFESMDEDTMTVTSTTHPQWTHTAVKEAILVWMGDPGSRMGLPKSVLDGWSVVYGGPMANSQPRLVDKIAILRILKRHRGLRVT
jgi:hypothetical protein